MVDVRLMFHYTDREGYNAIRSQQTWVFKAAAPPPSHPYGAYFTNYPENTPLLALKLRIPRSKIECVFCFKDANDLLPLRGGRGAHVFYSPRDYHVKTERQVRHGAREELAEEQR